MSKSDFLFELSVRLDQARRDANISQTQLAKILGMHFMTVSRYMRGEINIPCYCLYQMAKLFNVSIDYLFFGEE